MERHLKSDAVQQYQTYQTLMKVTGSTTLRTIILRQTYSNKYGLVAVVVVVTKLISYLKLGQTI